MRTDTINFLYIISSGNNDGVYKLGISVDPEVRLEQIKRDYDVPDAYIVETMDVPTRDEVFAVENALHTRFEAKRANHYQGREWFKLTQSDLSELRRMCQEQSNDFAQCQAFFGIVEASDRIENEAQQLEMERQFLITHNRRHGKTFNTTPTGVLKRYNELQRKLRSGTLGERFSFGELPHPTKRLLKNIVGEMEPIIQQKLSKMWLKLAIGGAAAGMIFGIGSTSEDQMGLAFSGGLVGLISGGINQSARKDSELSEANKNVEAAINRGYPGDLYKTLETVKDKKTGNYFLVRDFNENSRHLRNTPPRLPAVILPAKDKMLRALSEKTMFPVSGTIVTLGIVGMLAAGAEKPSNNRSFYQLDTTQQTPIIRMLDKG